MENQNSTKTTSSLQKIPIPIMIKRWYITFKKCYKIITAENRDLSSNPQLLTRPNICNMQPIETNQSLVTTASSEIVHRLAKNYIGLAKDRSFGSGQNNSSSLVELAFTFLLGAIGGTVGGHVGASLLPGVGTVYGVCVGCQSGIVFGYHISKILTQNPTKEMQEEKPTEHPVPVKSKLPTNSSPTTYFYTGQHGFWCWLADL